MMERSPESKIGLSNTEDWFITQVIEKSEISAVEYLTYILKDEDKWVRYLAAEALGEIGDKRGVDSLVTALRDTEQDVRIAASRSLWHIGKLGDARAFLALITS